MGNFGEPVKVGGLAHGMSNMRFLGMLNQFQPFSFELKRLSGHKIGQSYFLHAPEMEVAVLGSVVLGSVVLVKIMQNGNLHSYFYVIIIYLNLVSF